MYDRVRFEYAAVALGLSPHLHLRGDQESCWGGGGGKDGNWTQNEKIL